MGAIKFFQDYKLNNRNISTNFLQEKLPIILVKEYLEFFNISIDDISSLVTFSSELKEKRTFIKKNKTNFNYLTEKELEVFTLVVNGKNTNEIAEKLFIESCTVSTHRKKIKQKLQLNSIFDWYKYARAFDVIKF